jgi:hypothetical protein
VRRSPHRRSGGPRRPLHWHSRISPLAISQSGHHRRRARRRSEAECGADKRLAAGSRRRVPEQVRKDEAEGARVRRPAPPTAKAYVTAVLWIAAVSAGGLGAFPQAKVYVTPPFGSRFLSDQPTFLDETGSRAHYVLYNI